LYKLGKLDKLATKFSFFNNLLKNIIPNYKWNS
jgi:hypothetical protein